MLTLLLSSAAAFHAPASTPSQSAVLRARALVALSSEAAAKAAWLAKIENDWPRGAAAPLPAPAAAAPTDWLVPGKSILTLEAADHMSTVALREATQRGFNPISVVVLNAGGRTIVSKTMPDSSGLTAAFALAKATVCTGMHCSSREFRDKYQNDEGIGPKMPQLLGMGTAGAAANQALAPFPGGVMCFDAAGHFVGAIGCSGAASDEDEHCAITGAHAVGLVTDPAQSRLA